MNQSQSPIIVAKKVGVQFRRCVRSFFNRAEFTALKDVSFDLYSGDSLGVIGRNGAGKTTLLRLVGGIIRPDSGTIDNYGVSTALLSLQVGFDPELSGRVNAILSGMLLGYRKKDVIAQLDDIIQFSELENFIDLPVKSYSSGMCARLGFAVALEMNPDVLLIDEVLGVGDAEFREKSMAVMKEKLLSEQTIVFVSHDSNVVKSLCNRAVWIENGMSRMVGDSAEVVAAYEQYLAGRPRTTR